MLISQLTRKHLFIFMFLFFVSLFLNILSGAYLYFSQKSISKYESQLSGVFEYINEQKYASDQKAERRYEAIHKRYPEITRAEFKEIEAVFAKRGNEKYTANELRSLGYAYGRAKSIYELWYEA